MMKKLISMALATVMVISLAGCGSSEDSSSEATTEASIVTDEVVTVEMDASEYFELGEYKGLTIETTTYEVTDEEIEEELELLAEDYAEYNAITDRDTVEDGDYVNFDYTCTIDGEESQDYSEEEIDTQIGDQEYSIDDVYDLDAEMTGKKVGDTFTIEFTFPDDYDDEDVAGLDCSMEVTINAIEEEVIPEITDDFIAENTECSTVDEYKEQLREELEESYASESEDQVQDDLWNAIVDNSKQLQAFSDEMIAQEANNIILENEEWAYYFSMDTEEFIEEYYGTDVETYAEECLKNQCILDLLVEAEEITVTDDEYDAEIQLFIDDYGYEDEDEILEYYTEDEIYSEIVYTKLMTNLLSYTNVVETTDSDSE
ncbi:MAG: trigger factor [Clostridiales bacterium]|nr:trigger factor [Clostridiales bacterium]